MGVFVRIIGADKQSDEYACAMRLKELFELELPKSVAGEILLHPNATLIGQTVKDVDILMLGTLQNYHPSLQYIDNNQQLTYGEVVISSFCTAIEVKGHSIDSIKRQGTELFVKYSSGYHGVTTQSNKQKISVKNYFEQMVGYSPYVTNVIWFTGVSSSELRELLTIGAKEMPSNALPSSYSAKDLFQKIVLQKNLTFYHGRYHLDCIITGKSADDFSQLLGAFEQAKEGMGELTRKRIEQITAKGIRHCIEPPVPGYLSIYRGRAGTGKTVGLIQLAISLVDESDSRVLLLTYNRALVSDIRRLFALAELPDMFADSCVAVNTMQSFFYQIINGAFYNGALLGEQFLEKYEAYLQELNDFLSSGAEARDTIYEILGNDSSLNWDYCLIDEAQDWTKSEQRAIIGLFSPERIVVADGGLQFVRGIQVCDWSSIPQKKSTKLKYSMRQKSNLVKFINHYLSELGRPESRIHDGSKLSGGRVLICENNAVEYELFRRELKRVVLSGNIPYDMLFLCPSHMVRKNPRSFIRKSEFEKHGIFLWDGTCDQNRNSFPALGDEVRVLQYYSARGLEAWTVVCMELDRFIEERAAAVPTGCDGNSLLLESAEDIRLKYLINWLLIPLTRAIDTIVITIADPNSSTAHTLRKLSMTYPDYIQMVEE